MVFGGLEAIFILFGFGLALAFLAFWIWSIVDAARRPDAQWQAAGQSKTVWLVVIVAVGALGCGSFGWLGSLLYVLIPRPALKRAETAPPFPPAPGYYGWGS